MVKLYHWMDGIGPKEERKRQSNRIGGLSCEVDSMLLQDDDGKETGSACLDVSATYHDEKGDVIVAVVNRHPEQSVTAAVSLVGPDRLEISEAIELNCPSWEMINGFDMADQVTLRTKKDAGYDPDNKEYGFPPHPITLLKHRYLVEESSHGTTCKPAERRRL